MLAGRLSPGLVMLAFIVAFGWPSAVLAQRPLGVDVSYWQGGTGISQANWNNIFTAGRTFAFVRCTHYSIPGTESDAHGNPDPTCFVNVSRARAAGLLAGVYHFARPSIRDPQTEANAFVNFATVSFGTNMISAGYLRPVLDLEEAAGTVPVGASNLANWANAWINAVQQQTGVEAIVYCNSNYAINYLSGGSPSLANRTLWLANFSCPADPQTANPPGSNPDGIWSEWKFWQYCSTMTIPGVSLGNVDQDLFNGTAAQLQNFIITNPPMIELSATTLNRSVIPGTNLPSETFTVADDTSIPRNTLNYNISKNVAWLSSILPTSGASSGGANTHTINYATASLAAGHYTGTITVADPNAINSPQQLVVDLTVRYPGDVDNDGDADSTDFGLLQACLTSNAVPAQPACLPADFDLDDDVDGADFLIWLACARGADMTPLPDCYP